MYIKVLQLQHAELPWTCLLQRCIHLYMYVCRRLLVSFRVYMFHIYVPTMLPLHLPANMYNVCSLPKNSLRSTTVLRFATQTPTSCTPLLFLTSSNYKVRKTEWKLARSKVKGYRLTMWLGSTVNLCKCSSKCVVCCYLDEMDRLKLSGSQVWHVTSVLKNSKPLLVESVYCTIMYFLSFPLSPLPLDPDVSPSYPRKVIVPLCIPDLDLLRGAKLYRHGRFPTLSWSSQDGSVFLLRAAPTVTHR